MKKIRFLSTLVLAIAFLSGFNIPVQNEKTAINAKPSIASESSGAYKSKVNESKIESSSFKTNKVPESKPRILLMLKNETGQTKWTPSLWWNYEYANPYKPGC